MVNSVNNMFIGGLGFGDMDFGFSPISSISGFSMGMSASHLIYTGARLAGSFGGMGIGNVGRFQDRFFATHRQPRAGGNERRRLPAGTDSNQSDARGVNYMRQYFSGKGLPKQSDVIRNILGAPPKDPNAKLQYERDKADLKKKDDALRTVTEKLTGEWFKDPEKRAMFAKRWDNAQTDEDRIWALLDPKGDGVKALIGQLQGLIPELAGVQDEAKAIEIITGWFRDNFSDLMVGRNILVTMGAEMRGIAEREGLGSVGSIESRDQHISKLKEKGYTEEEAKQILSGATSEWEADTIVESMTTDMTRSKQTIDSYRDKLNELEATKVDKKNEKEKEERKKYLMEEMAKAERERAEAYARDFARAARILYGTRPDYIVSPPAEIKTGPEAIHWAFDQSGVNSDEPAPAKVEEAKKEEPQNAGGDKGKQGPKAPEPTTTSVADSKGDPAPEPEETK